MKNILLGLMVFCLGIVWGGETTPTALRKSAEQGDAKAQYQLGLCYAKGEGVKADAEKAVYWYQKAAEQGNATAQRLLGVCYFEGKGIEKNLTQAQYWLELAAAQNDTDAISRLKKLKKELEEELQ